MTEESCNNRGGACRSMREVSVYTCRGPMVLSPEEFDTLKRWSDSLRAEDPARVRVITASEFKDAMRALGSVSKRSDWSLSDLAKVEALNALQLSVTTQADKQRLDIVGRALQMLDADRVRVLDKLEKIIEEETQPDEKG